MFAINILIKIKEFIDFFSDSIFKLIQKYESKNKDVLFFIDKNRDAENVQLIDAFSLFEKALEKKLNAYYIISKTHPDYKKIKKQYGCKILPYSNFMHIKHFSKFIKLSKVFIAYEFLSPYGSYFRNSKTIDFIFIDHGVILLKNNIFDIYNKNEFDKFLVNNDYEAEIVKEYGNFKDEDLIKCALPRFDYLAQNQNSKKEILFFPTWRLSFNTIDYKKSDYYKSFVEFFNNETLHNMLCKNDIKLNVALHHSLIDNNPEFNFGENIVLCNSKRLSESIKSSSLLITDYSSVWSDFFFMNKPVIFFRPDINDEKLISRDRKNIEFASKSDNLLFNITENSEEVIRLIEHYIVQNFELEDEFKKKQDAFFYTKENIREKILREAGAL